MTDVRLIIGPPGTGKTRALTDEAANAADRYGADRVVIASLTRTAATEIAGRTAIPDQNVGTLHSHAFHSLERPKLAETPEGLRAWSDDHPDLRLSGGRGTLDDLDNPAAIDDDRTPADELHQAVMNHRARQTPPEQWSDAERGHYELWTDWKRQTGRLDFTDLIERALTDVDCHPAYPAVLLGDEAQDFSTVELALFRKWAAAADEAVIAADPDQTIYAWRGADPHAFRRIPEQNVRVLGQSYRVSRAVHVAATRWVQQIADRRDAAYQPRDNDGLVDQLDWPITNPVPIVERIRADVEAGRTVMLLASCGYMLAPALAELKSAGIPFGNPLRPDRGAWNPLRGASRLAAFLRPKRSVWGDQARPWTWDDLRLWTEPLQARDTLTRGSKSLIESKCLEDRFGVSQADEPVDFEGLCSLFGVTDDGDDQLDLGQQGGDAADHPAFVYDVDWWEAHLLSSAKDRMRYPLQVYRREGGAALVGEPRVTVGTIHSVKGGEADVVYLAPDLSKAAMFDWRLGGPPRDHVIRTFYVAATRAREQLRVLAPTDDAHIDVEPLTRPELMEAVAA